MTDEPEQPAPEVKKLLSLSRFDMRGLWRVTFWGASAACAIAVVAGTAFSEMGTQRLKLVLASAIEPASPAPPVVPVSSLAPELERETQQLKETVRDLVADRDRLKGRIAILEQSLDDITGAVKRQAAQTQSTQTAAKGTPAVPNPPPVISPPETIAAIPSPRQDVMPPSGAEPAATASVTETVTGPVPSNEPVPLPPTRLAATPPATEATASEQNPAPVARSEIGIDLGGASSLEILRQQWSAFKANHGPLIAGLRPSYTARQKVLGSTEYRLIAGPFPSAAAAMRLCSKLAQAHAYCRAGVFNVQLLASR